MRDARDGTRQSLYLYLYLYLYLSLSLSLSLSWRGGRVASALGAGENLQALAMLQPRELFLLGRSLPKACCKSSHRRLDRYVLFEGVTHEPADASRREWKGQRSFVYVVVSFNGKVRDSVGQVFTEGNSLERLPTPKSRSAIMVGKILRGTKGIPRKGA